MTHCTNAAEYRFIKWGILQGGLSALVVCILLIATFVLLGTEITLDLGVRIGIISLVGGIIGIFIGLATVIQ
jgi:hypothetical protein